MGFLSEAGDAPPAPEAPKSGGFLSDNPPPEPKVETKAPEWSDIPKQALVNAPESAWQFAKNMVQPILHPIDTAEALGKTGLGYMEKAGRHAGLPSGQGYEQYADALNQMVMDRYGSVDNFKKTLASDPVGVAGDLSMLLTGGGSAAARLPGVAGKVGEVAATAGRLTDPLTPVIGAGKLAGKTTSATAGLLTGSSMRPLEDAAKAGIEGGSEGRVFRANQNGEVPMEDVVRRAHDALDNMRKERGSAYTSGMSGVAQDKTILNWHDIGQAVRDAHKVQTYKGQELSPATTAIRNKMDNAIADWMALDPKEFHTPEGFDALKRQLDDIMRSDTEAGTPARTAASKYVGAVRNTIIKQVPEYAKVMKAYEEASDDLRQIEKTFSLPQDERKLNIDTALRKLQSTLRKNVNTNFGQREHLLDYIEKAGAPNLRAALAGQALSSQEAHGLARLGPAIGAISHGGLKGVGHALALGVLSPKRVGTAFYRAGQLAKPFKYVPRQTPEVLQQIGRWKPEGHNRGGAVDRALRLAKKR